MSGKRVLVVEDDDSMRVTDGAKKNHIVAIRAR